jgi:hypothetical protein
MNAMHEALTASSINPTHIHTELFGELPPINPGIVASSQAVRPYPPDGAVGPRPRITCSRSGLSTNWSPSSLRHNCVPRCAHEFGRTRTSPLLARHMMTSSVGLPRCCTAWMPPSTATSNRPAENIEPQLANLVVRASSDPELRAEIPLIVHDLAFAEGRKAANALLPSSGPIGLFGYGLQLGVQCSEHVPLTSQQQMRSAGKQALPDFPDAVLSLLPQTPYVFSDCAAWDVSRAGPGVSTRSAATSRCCWSAAHSTG